MKEHELKIHPEPFEALACHDKTHEVRSTVDRTFAVNDVLYLREYKPALYDWVDGVYTGRWLRASVTYITEPGTFGLPSRLCVMSVIVYAKNLIETP